jgi:aryl-alcohol dehydrogenase-like predicted oxidoreductase
MSMSDSGRSRRALLGAGLLAGLDSVLSRRSFAAAEQLAATTLAKLPVITRRIPSTGERLPAIGIGTNNFDTSQYAQLHEVLRRMHELGGAVIDTSDDYQDGEKVIGRVLADLGIRKQMFVVTKFEAQGYLPSYIPPEARNKIFGQESFDRSLQWLNDNQVDLLLAHHLLGLEPLMPLMQKLKRERKTRYIGVSTEYAFEHQQLADKMHQYPLDFVQLDYSIDNRDAASTVFPVAMARKIAVMIDIPIGSRHGPLVQRLGNRPLPSWAAEIDVINWSQFLLKYVISHPAVTCAIPGTTKVEHLVENQLACHGRLPDAAMRKKMEDYWDAIEPELPKPPPTRPPPAKP